MMESTTLFSRSLRDLLQSVIEGNAILQQKTKISPLDALLVSLGQNRDQNANVALYKFIDNCVLRLVRKPLKYCGDIADLAGAVVPSTIRSKFPQPLSLLLVVILEQLPFVLKTVIADDFQKIVTWLAIYLGASKIIGESTVALRSIQEEVLHFLQDKTILVQFENALESSRSLQLPPIFRTSEGEALGSRKHQDLGSSAPFPATSPEKHSELKVRAQLSGPFYDYTVLSRWKHEDMREVIENGGLVQLILCLSSENEEIRLQVINHLRLLMTHLEVNDCFYCLLIQADQQQVSGHPEWRQMYLFLGEIIETTKLVESTGSVSQFTVILAERCLIVLLDPLHFMYEKVNRFLNRNPEWNEVKLPSYWVDKVFLNPPSSDNFCHREVEWVLQNLMDGLVTRRARYNSLCFLRLSADDTDRKWRYTAAATYLNVYFLWQLLRHYHQYVLTSSFAYCSEAL